MWLHPGRRLVRGSRGGFSLRIPTVAPKRPFPPRPSRSCLLLPVAEGDPLLINPRHSSRLLPMGVLPGHPYFSLRPAILPTYPAAGLAGRRRSGLA